MSWNPDPIRFWDGIYKHPKEVFDPRDERLLQAEYLLKHPEIEELTTLLVAHFAKKSKGFLRPRKVLEEAALFCTRPAKVLQKEVDELLKKKGEKGMKPTMEVKKSGRAMRRPESLAHCVCPHFNTPSIESVYSSFITNSSSATTLASVKEEPKPLSLQEVLWELVLKSYNNALNTMYAARDHDIFYDEAYICITKCIYTAVDTVWVPIMIEINEMLNTMLGDVIVITIEKRNAKLLMTDKLPIKVNRLKNKFKGFAEHEDYPILKNKEIRETLECRQGSFNRYAKDSFGVYLSNDDKSLDVSTTYEPPCSLEEEGDMQNDSLNEFSFESDE